MVSIKINKKHLKKAGKKVSSKTGVSISVDKKQLKKIPKKVSNVTGIKIVKKSSEKPMKKPLKPIPTKLPLRPRPRPTGPFKPQKK
jgi:hypothetical protein